MKFNFDQVVDRRHTNSIKYDMATYAKAIDVLPLWVADMDFKAPPCVEEALLRRTQHGVFGYSESGAHYFKVLQNWFKRRHNWNIEQEWMIKTPGIVNAIHVAILALTAEEDGVLIQPPVYHPFASAVRKTGRRLVENELIYEKNRYQIDFNDFEQKIVQEGVKMFVLCSPHNPVGRVWTKDELTKMGEICLCHGVVVVADEIHQDFVYQGHKHLIFAAQNPSYSDIAITCTAPSKTFNLAGLPLSNIFISNAFMREKFLREYKRIGLSHVGVMGIVACQAAYENGDVWLEELLRYLAGNILFINEFLEERLPQVKMVNPEGTYLAWLDFNALGFGRDELEAVIADKARLWLNSGELFGTGGAGFQRLNAACPRSMLQEAMDRLCSAIHL